MAIPAIQDILTDWPGWAELSPFYGDETSGLGNGEINIKELRPMLWQLDVQSIILRPSEVKFWKARLLSLQNGKRLFYGYQRSSLYPIAYPKGTWPTGGAFDGVSAQVNSLPDALSLTLKGLPAGYTGKVGDFISVTVGSSLALHSVQEDFTANGSGVTGAFAVEPEIRPGMAINDAVAVMRPACRMMIVPGSLVWPTSDSAWGKISFKGLQVI